MSEYIKVAKTSEIADGKAKCVDVQGTAVALFNLGGTFHAIADECSHVGGSLSEGFVEGCEVECPWHGARFNIETGAALSAPATEDVKRYSLRVTGDEIEIEV